MFERVKVSSLLLRSLSDFTKLLYHAGLCYGKPFLLRLCRLNLCCNIGKTLWQNLITNFFLCCLIAWLFDNEMTNKQKLYSFLFFFRLDFCRLSVLTLNKWSRSKFVINPNLCKTNYYLFANKTRHCEYDNDDGFIMCPWKVAEIQAIVKVSSEEIWIIWEMLLNIQLERLRERNNFFPQIQTNTAEKLKDC